MPALRRNRNDCSGSKPEFTAPQQQGRFTPISGHTKAISTCAADRPWQLCDGDACVAERAVSGPQHTPDGRRMDGIGTRDIRLRLATGKPLERFLALVDS